MEGSEVKMGLSELAVHACLLSLQPGNRKSRFTCGEVGLASSHSTFFPLPSATFPILHNTLHNRSPTLITHIALLEESAAKTSQPAKRSARMPYNWDIAKDALTEAEKNRIVALYLSSDTAAVNATVCLLFTPSPQRDFPPCLPLPSIRLTTILTSGIVRLGARQDRAWKRERGKHDQGRSELAQEAYGVGGEGWGGGEPGEGC